MEEFEDDADIEINKPLDVRFIVSGLLLMISSLSAIIYLENSFLKIICSLLFLGSFLIMTKKEKNKFR